MQRRVQSDLIVRTARSDRAWGSAWIGVASLILLLCAAKGRADQIVEVKLSQDGRDVSRANTDAVALFYEDPGGTEKGGSHEALRCGIGTLCALPPGTYWVDLASTTLVAETRPSVTVEQAEPRSPPSFALTLRVTRAGTIEIPGARLPAGSTLTAVDEKTGELYSRRVDGPVAHVRVPGRSIILCAFAADSKPIGCLRVAAKAGESVTLAGLPLPARGRGQLFVGLVYPNVEAPWDAAILLRVGEKKLAPDVVTARYAHFYAIWFDVPAGQGTLELESKYWTTDSRTTFEVPERGTAVRMKIPIVRRPTLKVTLLGGAALGEGTLSADLFSCNKHLDFDQAPALSLCSLVATTTGSPAQKFEFANLASSAYAFRWKKPPFESAVWIDMRDGKSRDEKVPVELIELSGRVTLNGKGVPARIHWEAYNSGAACEAAADDDGRFSVTVAQKGKYFVTVGFRGGHGRTFTRDFLVGDLRTYDIEIPGNKVLVRVVSGSGNAVAGARVSYEIRTPPPEDLQKDADVRLTDQDGKAELPPLPAGMLTAHVSAQRYRTAEIQPLEITETTGEREILVTLTAGAGIQIHILEPGGSPASGARVWSEGENASATADASGTAVFEEPLATGAPLIAFDAAGSMGFSRYSGEDEQTIQIPTSGPPFIVRFLSPDGKPLPLKNVFVGIDGVLDTARYMSQALASGGDPSSLPDGSLRVAGLPAEGTLTISPAGRLDLAITRPLPVREEIVFTLPLGD